MRISDWSSDVCSSDLSDDNFAIQRGDRIAQLVPAAVQRAAFAEVDTLGETARGAGGFGSTGVASGAADAKDIAPEGVGSLAAMKMRRRGVGGDFRRRTRPLCRQEDRLVGKGWVSTCRYR